MDKVELFKKVVMGAATSTLDVAGAALVPGWPIFRGALTPVLDRLSERFAGQDITSSPELAGRAVLEFADDKRLQELLKSNLLDALDPVIKTQQYIGHDVQFLCELVMENSKALDEIKIRLDKGVILSDEAMEELSARVADKIIASQKVRQFEHKQIEVYPYPKPPWMSQEMIKIKIIQIQIEAVEFIREGRVELAMENLKQAGELLGRALEETPTDVTLKVLQGYFFKNMAQAFFRAGHRDLANQFIDNAEKIFNLVAEDLPADQKTLSEAASAINGLGNVYHFMKDYEKAIIYYKRATTVCPDYAYAWHDLFGAYNAMAKEGVLKLENMREAYLKLRKTASAGLQGLGPEYLAQLEIVLNYWEESNTLNKKNSN